MLLKGHSFGSSSTDEVGSRELGRSEELEPMSGKRKGERTGITKVLTRCIGCLDV
jgi:hypothetical protein